MKRSAWAKEQGISYQAAWRIYRDGKLPVPAEKLPTGRISVKSPKAAPTGVAVYARMSRRISIRTAMGRWLEWSRL